MHHDVFLHWKRERDAIEQEMKLFLAAGRRAPLEDRGVRQIQFAALIERRNAAARNLLQSVRAARGQTATVVPLSTSPSTSPPTAAEVAEQDAKSAGGQTATVVPLSTCPSTSPPTAAEVAEQGMEPVRGQTMTVIRSSAPPRTAEEAAEQGAEPAALDRAIEAMREIFSEESFDFFDFNRGHSSILPQNSTRPEDPALAKALSEERLSDHPPVEAQRYPRVTQGRATSARFLRLWRVRVVPRSAA